MARYHISSNGEPVICEEPLEECPVGAESPHGEFDSKEAAEEWSAEVAVEKKPKSAPKRSTARKTPVKKTPAKTASAKKPATKPSAKKTTPVRKPRVTTEQLLENVNKENPETVAAIAKAFGVTQKKVAELEKFWKATVVVKGEDIFIREKLNPGFRPAKFEEVAKILREEPATATVLEEALSAKGWSRFKANPEREDYRYRDLESHEVHTTNNFRGRVVPALFSTIDSDGKILGVKEYNAFLEEALEEARNSKKPLEAFDKISEKKKFFIERLDAEIRKAREQAVNSIESPKGLLGILPPTPWARRAYHEKVAETQQKYYSSLILLRRFADADTYARFPEL